MGLRWLGAAEMVLLQPRHGRGSLRTPVLKLHPHSTGAGRKSVVLCGSTHRHSATATGGEGNHSSGEREVQRAREADLARKHSPTSPEETIFSKILRKEVPADILHEDEKVAEPIYLFVED